MKNRPQPSPALLAALALLLDPGALPAAPLRPPAVPLVAHDPYFSIWSAADKLTDTATSHWTGKPHRLTALARIDGKPFRVLGNEPPEMPALPQTGIEVLPTRTVATFEGAGIRLELTFLTPALPDDLEVLARPVTYVSFEAGSADGKPHEVACYLDAAAEIAVNEPEQQVEFSRADTARLAVLRVASKDQPVLARKGDDLRIDWGSFYLAAPKESNAVARLLPAALARDAFAAGGELPMAKTACPLPAAGAPVAAVAWPAARTGAAPLCRWLMLAYDDEFSIRYFRAKLRPWWRRDGADAPVLLERAAADRPSLVERCRSFDRLLVSELGKFGDKYASLCALAYRQTLAGNKIVADAKGKPLMFPKENFSNGCIGTVDVLFPQAPFFLTFSPALAKAMLQPVLDYAASPQWPYDYAPHDLGTYPHATGQVYGMNGRDGDRMPVEESGNMLIMLAALAGCEGNADFAKPYAPMLRKWADYLVKEGLDPRNQLCSADMFGHLPRAANLALKAIIAIGGYAQLCERFGQAADAERYQAIARDYAAKWLELAADEGRTRLAYHLPGTWGMKHNLIWDRVLGTKLFPDEVAAAEIAWYLKVQKTYGLPVDNRTDTSLIDWALWSIAPASRQADFEALLDPIWRYANETPSRVPLSDWFFTTNAARKGFQARPVVGGIFIKLLAEPALRDKWSKRGANVAGPWAPIPLGDASRETAPTARTAPAKWRDATEQPPAGWDRQLPGLRKLMDTPLRDTSLCRGPDGTWYLTGTVEPFWAYNEGIKVWKSKDMTEWTPLGFVWKYGASPWHQPYLEKKKPLWAPEIHFLKGTFWLTYSIPGWDGTGKTSGSGLLKSTSGKAEGPYRDMQPQERIGDEIDASLFQDDDGEVYFLWHSGKIARMKPDMSGLAEPYRWLKTSVPDPDPRHHSGLCAGIFGKDSFDHVGFEGMFLFKAGGRYFLSCAESIDGRYSCMIASSTHLFGPYGPRHEALPHAGHNMFFRDDSGHWWSTYFGSDDGAPWRERPGILPVEIGPEGLVKPRTVPAP